MLREQRACRSADASVGDEKLDHPFDLLEQQQVAANPAQDFVLAILHFIFRHNVSSVPASVARMTQRGIKDFLIPHTLFDRG